MDRATAPVLHLFQPQRQLQDLVHALAEEGRVAFRDSAIDQMQEQSVSDIQLLRFLQKGTVFRSANDITTPPGRNEKWLCKIIDSAGRERRTVTAVIKLGGIYVLTVHWDIVT